ncbi:MAG TPA: glycerol-3-phosphate acyltransferase [Candidatus Protoclostridium stercorigallinarum]|uniref:Glycerol-3-phosphate acyltransferase n=1 Tax=Candidatus Protoclostridium stercorigallinarum TaxID=2838741 RepID=A0A9D1TSR5_9FIRM|nr:glycerol-3-phosphate acyltransferase [Candidatus Protoclostridium stercorigallinarum]
MALWLRITITAVVSYFIGNVNFALVLSRLKHGDIRNSGSGNPGTMNVVRTYGKIVGALCLILDAFKAAVPAFFFWWLCAGEMYDVSDKLGLYVSGLSVVVGHIFPVCLKFRGGKGIACIIGVALLAHPLVTLIAFAAGLIFLIVVKIGALSSFIMIFVPNIYEAAVLGGSQPVCSWLIFAMLTLAVIAHHANIVRLFSGTENLTVLFKKKKR